MFGGLSRVFSDINIFDLREPKGFRFNSLAGIVIYILIYTLAFSYDDFFHNSKCFDAVSKWDSGVLASCGISPYPVLFQLLYMAVAFLLINIGRKGDWSPDAVFNNLSVLITVAGGFTFAAQTLRSAAESQAHPVVFFALITGAAIVTLGAVSLLAGRYNIPGQAWWKFRPTSDFYRLLILYAVLIYCYFYWGFKLHLADTQ